MSKRINCFISYTTPAQTAEIVSSLVSQETVNQIYVLGQEVPGNLLAGCIPVSIGGFQSTDTVRQIALYADSDYTLIYTKDTSWDFGLFALERMLQVADDSGSGLLYADHYKEKDQIRTPYPLIDYQSGSLRDDFDLGPLLLYRSDCLKKAAAEMQQIYQYAGWYDLRLRVSRLAPLVRVNEYLYTEKETSFVDEGEKQFQYVDAKNRQVQMEMEAVCTNHLMALGGFLLPQFKPVDLFSGAFSFEASVIIPVRNRVKTIADAIRSVLTQKTTFAFNLIIIDNYSDDGTTEVIRSFGEDNRVIHLIPENKGLGIGGCWNVGVHHPACGRFAVQLDSDDLYSGEDTLQKIVDAFYQQQCAMVVGTYCLTDFNLNTIPPGVIDHREWTPDNGPNNALRINGLGAPRAFYTPLLRKIKVPNTSYGEDYALGLRFSREYRIGRIYEVLYLCRRWEDNSDASPDITKTNLNNLYKDRLRTWELQARIRMNEEQKKKTV